MSGLFTRLARHAVGQPGNLVHAASPTPYQQSTELASTEQVFPQSEAATDSVVNNPQSTAGSTPPPGIVAQSDARTKASSVDEPGRLQPPGFSEQPGNDRIDAQRAMSDSTGDALLPRQAADPISQVDDLAAVTTGMQNSGVFDRQQKHEVETVAAASATEKIILETLVDDQPRNFGASRQQQASPVEPRTPEPLLPSFATTPTANSVAAMQTPEVTSDTPNEVHVHIGRIEVTAVQSGEPRKRKAKAAQQPMSLDDYLARRQRS